MSKSDRGSSKDIDREVSRPDNVQMVLWSLSSMIGILILLQSLREFFASVYFYNLISLSISPVSGLLLIFLLPLLTGKIAKRIGLRNMYILSGAVMIAARIPMGMGLDRPAHLVLSTISLAGSMYFLSLVLALHRREREMDPEVFSSQSLVAYFGLAYLLLLLLNALGHGVDASVVPKAAGQVLSPAISTAIAGVFGFTLFMQKDSIILEEGRGESMHPGALFTGGMADSWAPAWGLGGSIFVLLAVISNPSVVSGWLQTEFELSLSMSMASVGIFLLSLLSSSGVLLSLRRTFSNPKGAILGNIILVIAAANLFYIGVPLPIAPAVIVWIAMVDTWVILDAATDSRPFAGESIEIESGGGRKVIGFPHRSRNRLFPGHFGKATALAFGMFALIIVLLTISLNWSFVPMGALLKGAVPSLMFLGSVVLAISGFSCSKFMIGEPWVKTEQSALRLDRGSPTMAAGEGSGTIRRSSKVSPRLRIQWITLGSVTICLIILTGVVSLVNYSSGPVEKELSSNDLLKVATYNIHHGFSNDGRVDPTKHLELIREVDPDIIFLQESDSLLFSEGNFDPAFYLASRTDMYLFRGPHPGTGSPGVAILTRFPMKDLKVHYLPSDAIQRIALSCTVEISDEEIRLIGVHMGLEEGERRKQLEELKGIIEAEDLEVILGGDLNTEPHEKMMQQMNPDLFGSGNVSEDSTFLQLGSVWHTTDDRGGRPLDTPTYPAPDVDDESAHIDYVLFSEGFDVLEAGIEDGEGISDHRLVWGHLKMT
ncbi:MAG: endonuclease/exonuclease/phosphatase family protein [Thermoplasmatota archaeon]